MSEIVCRRPSANEAEPLCALIRQILITSFPTFPPEAVDDYLKPWTPDSVISRLERGHDILIAAYAGDEVIGLVSGTALEGGVGTVIWLLVDTRWRGHKAGRALYEAACRAYRELGAHKMKLTAPSEGAKRFYESCGMCVEGFHRKHWYKMDFFSLGVVL
ncbi:MAG: Acetyltransferase domain [Blastocatellia bacterium]|jgi:ribosomal protein S18 acetylase RimI-like enzyme|nr:Acetyltransferase domain [Blastocatellia bacterium]